MCARVKRRGCCKNKIKRLGRDKLHSEIPSRFDNGDRIVSFNFYFSIELRLKKIHGRKVKRDREKERERKKLNKKNC